MILLLASLIVAGAIGWTGQQLMSVLREARSESSRSRQLALLELFAPGLAAAESDPQTLLVWEPLARTARQLFPDECAALDRASGATFPFDAAQIQAAHSRWTADWLAWERTHDAVYKLKASAAEQELKASGESTIARGRLDAVENEKIDLYQRRYQEYIRVAKGLQALI